MNAAVLREAAALMRESVAAGVQPATDARVLGVHLNNRYHLTVTPEFLASIADWLDNIVDRHAHDSMPLGEKTLILDPSLAFPFAVARAYLGTAA